ncbi:MAG: hypothetical protein HYY16_07600 [Planctomycetes bacterium]|nr:hypothetical protein [Planctomycetota bacterium]
MKGRWKERMQRLGRASDGAREQDLRSMTETGAARILEGLLSTPLFSPICRPDHPVSLSHRMRRHHV